MTRTTSLIRVTQPLRRLKRRIVRMPLYQRLDHLIETLIEPSAAVTDAAARQQARLVSSAIVAIVLLVAGTVTWRVIVYPEAVNVDRSALIVGATVIPIYPFLHILTRRGHYRLAGHFIGIHATLAILLMTLISPGDVGWTYLYFFVVVVVGISQFVSTPAGVIYAITHQGIMLVLGVLRIFDNDLEAFADPSTFNLFVAALIILSSLYRDQIETAHRRELKRNETRYRVISESVADFVYACHLDDDRKLVYDWVTQAAAAVTGYSWEELQANPALLDTMIHPDDRKWAAEDTERVIRSGHIGTGQYRLIRRDRETRWVLIKRRPIWDEGERTVVGVYCIAQDITEHRAAEAERMRVALERDRMTFVSQFVQAVSHEFRTNLANIETNRYLIQRVLQEESDRPLEERSTEATAKAEGMRMHIQRMTEQLRNLGTITNLSGFTRQPTSIAALIEGAARDITPAAAKNGITVIIRTDPTLPPVTIHKEEMRRALRHLLDNALRFTPSGGSITLTNRREGEYLLIDVIDTGTGIALDQQERIFDLFYKVDAARSMSDGGMGLGLSIVRLVMEAHGGIVSLESQIGSGSMFTLWLPLNPPDTGGTHSPKPSV